MESNGFKRVKELVATKLDIKEDFSDDAHFVNDLGADSLDTVELVMAFEQEFACEIGDEDAEKIRTVRDAVDYLQSKGIFHEKEASN